MALMLPEGHAEIRKDGYRHCVTVRINRSYASTIYYNAAQKNPNVFVLCALHHMFTGERKEKNPLSPSWSTSP